MAPELVRVVALAIVVAAALGLALWLLLVIAGAVVEAGLAITAMGRRWLRRPGR